MIDQNDTIVHIKVDHSHMQKFQLGYLMLEQTVSSLYEDVKINKSTNQYGLLTDIWIHFKNSNDAMHFRLSFQ